MKKPTEQRRGRNRAERRQVARALLLGLSITGIVIACDMAGLLQSLEWWFYDERVRLCQLYRKPPTDRLVHVDIDDSALETIGRWPWHRNILADAVDELRRAGAKAVAFDVLLSEPEEPKREANGKITDYDAQLAEAIQRMGNVLVPASLIFERPPVQDLAVLAGVAELTADLELSRDEVNVRLAARGRPGLDSDRYVHALRRAMDERVRAEIAGGDVGPEVLVRTLLPKLSRFGSNPPSVHMLMKEQARLRAERALEPFTFPMPAGLSLMRSHGAIAPVPAFSAAARYSGLVDQVPLRDGVVRTVPVVAEFHGRLLPQMGLVLACAALDIDPRSIRVSQDRLVLPLPDGQELTVPVSAKSTRFGRVGMFMEVPWFGGREWQSMYQGRNHQHINIGVLTELAELRRRVRINNAVVDERLNILFKAIASLDPLARTFTARGAMHEDDFESRRPLVQAVLTNDDVKFLYEIAAQKRQQTPQELNDDDRGVLSHVESLGSVIEQSPQVIAQLKDRGAEVGAQLLGRIALIGSTASSSTDMVNTPLATQVPGVLAHGVVFNGIITRELWRIAPDYLGRLYALAAGLLATAAVAFLKPWRATFAVGGLLIGYLLLNGFVLFDRGNYLVATAAPVMAMVAVWTLENLISLTVETAERARVTNRFRNRVDPQLVDYVLEHPEHMRLEGQVKELTVVFTDLEGFTAVSEKLREKTVEILNEYFKRMVPLIRQRRGHLHGGYVNKLLGDGMMFVFGAPFDNPHHATDAVQTVLDMIHETERFSMEMVSRGLPPVVMRAGVNTGPMMVGDAGADTASDYTVIGDAVNTSARLEKANKRFDSRILIGGGTQRYLDGRFLTRSVGALMLAGKSEAVDAFEVMARSVEATDAQRRVKALSEAIVTAYATGQIAMCLQLVENAIAVLGRTKFLAVYEKLCHQAVEDGASQSYVLA